MFGRKSKKLRGDAAKEIRKKDLTAPAGEIAPDGVDTSEVWMAVVEVSKPESMISYVSFSNGDTASYYTKGKGIEGLGEIDAINKASKDFVEVCAAKLDQFDETNEIPYPTAGMVRFYCRKGDTTYTAQSLEDIVSVGGHPLTPMYKRSQDVMKQVQLAESRR